MAILSLAQAVDHLTAPKHKKQLKAAKRHEGRMRMHTEPILETSEMTEAHFDYLATIDKILTDKDKQERFRQLMPLPLPTTALCESLYQEYPRALMAHNKYIKSTFTAEELEVDFKDYLEEMGFMDFWNTNAISALRKYINAFVVVDLPRKQTTPRPAPYMYLLQIDAVIDVDVKKGVPVAEYIIFAQDLTREDVEAKITARAIVIDDMHYRMYYQNVANGSTWQLDFETPHGLPQCPAFKIYPELVTDKNRLNSQSPITTSLGDLNDYITAKVSIKYYQTYGMFPIYWGYKQKCTYVDQKDNATCNGNGRLVYYDTSIAITPGNPPAAKYRDCPACSARKMIGPGTFLEVDPPRMKDEADLREPVGFVGVDVDALDFAEKKVDSMENKITYHTTGKTSQETQSKEALNEMDVKRQFESRHNILMMIKKNFEVSIYWALTNMGQLRYGDQYTGSTVDLGSEFFLRSQQELNKSYQEKKTAGRPAFELATDREFYYLTEYHNNPEELARLNILQNLEPYQDYSCTELKALGTPLVDPEGYMIKLNFSSYLMRFERENMPILQFGAAISFAKKIEVIFDTLKSYANEQLTKADREGGPFTPKVSSNQKPTGAGN